MEKVSMIDNQKKTIKSPYLSIKFPYKNIKIEVSMNKLFTILAIADATRNQSHINKIMETLDEVFAHCTSIEDYARISYVFDKAQRLGGLAQEIAKDVLDKLNEKEEEMLSKLPKDSKVTCTIPEVDGIYSKYRKYKDVAGINTKNAELRRKSIKYIQALQFADNSRRKQDFENLKVAIRNVIHECKDEKDFDDVERMLSELKNIGGIAVNIFPVASNMNKQAKEHFLEQKKAEEKKAIKEANKTVKPKHELKSQKQVGVNENEINIAPVKPIVDKETESNEELIEEAMLEAKMREKAKRKQESEIIFDESMLEEYYKLKRIAYDAAECNPHHTHVEEFYEGMNACRKAIDVLDSFKKIAPIELLKKESGIIEELLSTLRRRLFIAEEEEVQRRRNRNR